MKRDETYKKVIRKLKESDTDFTQKDFIVERVMQQISESGSKKMTGTRLNLSTGNWVRWSLSTAAAAFIILFFSQQIMIANRLDKLEGQLVQTDETIEVERSSMAPSHRVVLRLISERKFDSITVARDDLEKMLKEYMKMQDELNEMKNGSINIY